MVTEAGTWSIPLIGTAIFETVTPPYKYDHTSQLHIGVFERMIDKFVDRRQKEIDHQKKNEGLRNKNFSQMGPLLRQLTDQLIIRVKDSLMETPFYQKRKCEEETPLPIDRHIIGNIN